MKALSPTFLVAVRKLLLLFVQENTVGIKDLVPDKMIQPNRLVFDKKLSNFRQEVAIHYSKLEYDAALPWFCWYTDYAQIG